MELVIILPMLVLSAYFSSIEMAFFSVNRFRIELLSNQGDRIANILSNYLHNTSRFIATILIANNLALVIYGRAMGQFIESNLWNQLGLNSELDTYSLLVFQTFIATLIVLVFGEYLPKALAANFPLFFLRRTAWLMEPFYRGLKPVVWLIDQFTRLLIRRLRIKDLNDNLVFSKRDLHAYVVESIQRIPEHTSALDVETFSKALDFNQVKVREFMVPRTEIVALPSTASIDELRELFIQTELSRIVIYDDTLDRIRGYVHTRSLFANPTSLMEIVQRIMFVPETMSASTLLSEFNNRRKSMAIVVDEFGGTAGLVTVEDLVETVFGDIDDEHDEENDDEWIEEIVNPDEYVFSGRLEISYLNEKYELNLPEGEYSTLSGLIMQTAERIPTIGEVIEIPHFKFVIQAATRNRIDTVRLYRISSEE